VSTPNTGRIVVTGLGAVSPIGDNAGDFWQSLVDGRSGIAGITSYDVGGTRPAYAGEVKTLPFERAGLPRKKLKTMGRQAQLAFVAVQEAAADAQLDTVNKTRLGVLLGVGMLNADVTELGRAFSVLSGPADHLRQGYGGLAEALRAEAEARHRSGPAEAGHYSTDVASGFSRTGDNDRIDVSAFGRAALTQMFPLWLLRHIPNLAAAYAAISLDARASSNTIATGCVAAANAIGEAARIIARGDADVVIAGGADARVSPLAMIRYRDLGWLATRDDVEPAVVSCPFDQKASGFVNAEGAGMLVLESLQHAERRGARIRAELVGYGAANDAFDVLRPHPDGLGLERAITRALDRSGLREGDVDAVFAPATSIPDRDRATARALEHVFDVWFPRPTITATRSIVGHAHAASSALDCVAAVRAIETSTLPPTINVSESITDLRLCTDTDTEPPQLDTVLVGASGFGGHAAALLWKRYE
jgi:3-oxoacyl-[acyl-carrier-protein] synthase II